jgi:PEP-CTERM motif
MKVSFVALLVLAPFFTQAQGTVYSSNLGNTPTGSFTLASDSWIAQEFSWLGLMVNGVTLTPPCTLNSIQLQMGSASGSPSDFSVSIYTRGASGPGTRIGALVGDPDPQSTGVYTYTASGITLAPATGYLVVVTSQRATAEGAYSWSTAFLPSQSYNDNLRIGYYFDSTDGVSWTEHIRQDVGLMAIYGTPVPEPSSCFLFAFGAVCFVFMRKCCTNRIRVLEAGISQ